MVLVHLVNRPPFSNLFLSLPFKTGSEPSAGSTIRVVCGSYSKCSFRTLLFPIKGRIYVLPPLLKLGDLWLPWLIEFSRSETIWLWGHVIKAVYLPLVSLSLRMLTLGTQPPCCEEAQAILAGSQGKWSRLSPWALGLGWTPAGNQHQFASHVSEPSEKGLPPFCPSTPVMHMEQRQVLPAKPCPDHRYICKIVWF